MFILLVKTVVRMVRQRPVAGVVRWGIGILLVYCLVWGGFSLARRYPVVPFGTEICFDDWCATVNGIEQVPAAARDSIALVLTIMVSNHARGIAQRPSEPRVHLIDDRGRRWLPASWGAVPLDSRLELHESKKTTARFVVPAEIADLKVLIEEGPWITRLLFPEDQPVFSLKLP